MKTKPGDELNILHLDRRHAVIAHEGEAGEVRLDMAQKFYQGDPLPAEGELVATEQIGRGRCRVVGTFQLSGPPQVATPAYKDGWERIFGGKRVVGKA